MAATKATKPSEPKTYKTVAKLLKAYASGELSSRKDKVTFDVGGDNVEVTLDRVQDVVFTMGIGDFINQVAKIGGVKIPT